MIRAAQRCHRLNSPKKEINDVMVMEKLSDKVATMRTLTVETDSNFEVDVYESSTNKTLFACRFPKEYYTLDDVHLIVSIIIRYGLRKTKKNP